MVLCELTCFKSPFNRLDLRPKGVEKRTLVSDKKIMRESRIPYAPISLSRNDSKRVVTLSTVSFHSKWALCDTEQIDNLRSAD